MAFCALIHAFHPDSFDYSKLNPAEDAKNLQFAFDEAEKHGVVPLLEVEDITSMPKPDKLSMITYVSQYYHTFNKLGAPKVKLDAEKFVTANETVKQENKQIQVRNAANAAAAKKSVQVPVRKLKI
jgi:hypothetical protein